jgi:hypothetical protein
MREPQPGGTADRQGKYLPRDQDGAVLFNGLVLMELLSALGIALLVGGAAVFRYFPDPGWQVVAEVCFFMTLCTMFGLIDLFLRYVSAQRAPLVQKLMSPSAGGILFFAPVWLVGGLAALGVLIFVLLQSPAKPGEGGQPPAATGSATPGEEAPK